MSLLFSGIRCLWYIFYILSATCDLYFPRNMKKIDHFCQIPCHCLFKSVMALYRERWKNGLAGLFWPPMVYFIKRKRPFWKIGWIQSRIASRFSGVNRESISYITKTITNHFLEIEFGYYGHILLWTEINSNERKWTENGYGYSLHSHRYVKYPTPLLEISLVTSPYLSM